MWPQRRQRQTISEINVVPYIDVMLVLLIIFMITAPLLTQGVSVQLPQAQAETLSAGEREPIIVSIDQQGRYFLNVSSTPQKPIEAGTLLTQVATAVTSAQARGSERVVLVKGDEFVEYGQVVQLMVLLQQAGVPQVGLMTQPPQTG